MMILNAVGVKQRFWRKTSDGLRLKPRRTVFVQRGAKKRGSSLNVIRCRKTVAGISVPRGGFAINLRHQAVGSLGADPLHDVSSRECGSFVGKLKCPGRRSPD